MGKAYRLTARGGGGFNPYSQASPDHTDSYLGLAMVKPLPIIPSSSSRDGYWVHTDVVIEQRQLKYLLN